MPIRTRFSPKVVHSQTRKSRKELRKADCCKFRAFRPRWEAMEDRTLMATMLWANPAGGDWDVIGNWVNSANSSDHHVPTSADDAQINVAGITVTHTANTTDSVDSVSVASGSTLAVSNGTLSIVAASASSPSDSGSIAVSAGATLSLGGAFTLNSGSKVSVTNSTLNLGSSSNAWTDGGTITATGSTVNLGGDFTLSALGSFTRSGGTVNLTGTLNDTSATLALDAATGSWNLLGGTISGGTVTEAAGAELAFTTSGGTLAGVTFDNNLDLTSVSDANATVTGGLTLDGATVYLGNVAGSTYGYLYFNGTQTLGGTGTVLFGKDASNALDETASAATLTIAAGVTVRGSAGTIASYYASDTVVNQGTIAADDSGGLTTPFVYDTDFSGGSAGNTAAAIDVSGVTNPAPQAVYQTYRAGAFTYTLTGLTPSSSYTLRLHFADPSSTAAGQRQFDVSLNGTAVLTNFDVFATAGGENKAVVQSLAATANAQGDLVIAFAYGTAGTPFVNGIEVDSGSTVVQAINCGELAGGTITVDPATFTNQGTLKAQNGETLSIGGTWSNAAGKAIAAIGATLNLGNSTNAWSNAGSITSTGSTVNLGGDFTLAALGSFTPSAGTTVNLTGTLNNTGTTLALDAATGSWNLLGGTISGGTVTEAAGAELAFTTSGGTLAGVTFDNNLDLASVSNANATVTGGLTLDGATVYLGNVAGSTYGYLYFSGTQTLGGTGTVLFGKDGSNALDETASAATLTIAAGVTVRGSAGTIASYYASDTVVNQGTIAADDSGGLTTPFVYDTDFSGGFTGNTAAAIDVSGVTNPAPQAVYQTYRAGSFTYTVTGLTPSASYTLRLHFADPSSTAAGQRQFDVSLNGTAVLTNFDVFATAGGENKAVVQSLTATANAQGDLVIAFAYGAAGTPFVNGIEVDSASTLVQAINCGELAGGTITVDPTTFTNQGTLKAQNGDTLSIGGAWSNAAGKTISATGATLNLGNSTNAWSNAGSITSTGSTVNLGGDFTLAALGSFTPSAGTTVNLTGTLNNTGTTLALNAATGSWNLLGGTISGGTVTEAAGAELVFTTSGGTLAGVTFDNNLDLASVSNANATVTGGLTLDGATVYLGNVAGSTYGYLYFSGTQTLGGTGTVLFGKDASNALDETASAATLTIAAGVTVRGSAGTIASYYASDTVVNQGTIAADDSGGLTTPFVYDTDFSGGSAGNTAAAIDVSGVTNPAPQAVYQTYRAGAFTYTVTGLTPSASYTLRLHFADPGATAAGQRQFDVSVNGTAVLTNFDVFATAGGENKAVVQSLAATANAQGDLVIAFAYGTAGTPFVNGIEVDSGSTTVQAINCGELAGGTITVDPATFTNQGTLKAQNGDTLSIGGTWSNAAGKTIAATGATLNLGNSTNAWSNAGSITATGSTVNLGGDFTLAALGSFTPSAGTTVNLTGTLNNTGTTLALNAATGSWNLLGGTISGGTVTEAAGAELVFTTSGGTLAGVTFDNNLDLASVSNANATVTGGLTLDGATVYLGNVAGSTYGYLYFSGTQTLGGTGTVLFGKDASNALDETASAATLTIAAGVTVRGSAGTIASYYASDTVVNQGTIAADDSGGLTTPFVYDTDFSGGSAGNTAAAIDVSGVTNPAPQAVYQTYRAGAFTYTVTGLTPSASYTLRLHFADPGATVAGQRQFDVSVNGTAVLTNFDVFATAGGENKAVVQSLAATANAQGDLVIAFAYGAAGTPFVNGIEVDSGSTTVQAINCGELAGGTITVDPAAFTNQGTLKAQNGETLSIGGTWSNAAGKTIAATGATLNLGNSTNAWSNAGSITATGSTVNLGGDFTLAALGSFTPSAGTTVNLTGTLDNTGTTLALNAATGSWNLVGGTISGGTVTEAAGAELAFTTSGGTLAGVTFDNNLDLASVSDANVTVTDGLTLDGATVFLGDVAGATYGYLYFSGTQTLGGTGTVLFGKDASNALYETASAATLTIAAGVTVRGSAGTITSYYSSDTVVNQGTIAADDSGGLTTPFVYDTDFSGGSAGNTAATIDVSGVTNPAPQAVYQTYRAGAFTYTLTGLTPSSSYTLRLHFADPGATAAGQRQFDVSVNGTAVLTNFDVFATAGGENKAVVQSLAATANAQGDLVIAFAYGAAGTPFVNGIEVDSGSTLAQAINCGELAGGTLTIGVSNFTNQGTIQATNGGSLSVAAAAWTNQGVMEADTGSVVKASGNLTLAATSQVNVEVSGTTAGAFGQIVVSGSASLNGTLNVIAGAGFTVNTGDAIQVMTFASYTDNFVNVTGTSFGRYAFLVETIANDAVTLTATMSAEDLAAGTIVASVTGVAGQDVSITYTAANLSDVAISGDWFDSLYLTQSDTLDASAVVLDRIERTTPVPAYGSYTVTLDVPLPGVLPGNYHVILFVDSRGLLPDANRANNLETQSTTMQVTVPSISLNSSTTATISSGQAIYYGVDIPAGHDVVFTVDSAVAGAAELYLSYGAVPSASQHDEFAFNQNSQHQEIGLSGATQGTYYIFVQGQGAAASGDSLTIGVHDAPFSVVGVSTTQVDTGDPFTATLTGFQFSPQTTAALVGSSGTPIAAQSVTYINRNTLYATFEVPLFDDGVYSVQVQQGGQSSTLSNAITAATQPNSAQATFSMSVPQYVGATTRGFITITYANNTGNDIPAPLLNVTANNALVRLPDESSFSSNVVQFLGINTNGPAGVLPPGARGQLVVYFQVDVTDPTTGVFFNLYPSLDYYNVGDSGQTQFTMNWSSVEAQFRPASIPVDAWSAVWNNFLTSVGTTVAQFHTRMDIDANYLSQFGDYEYDLSNLVAFEVLQADDWLPMPTLSSVEDTASPAPGIPLNFSREYLQSISGRYQLGPLGRGWVDNWEISLAVDSQGNATVSDDGQDQLYTPTSNGSFQSSPGDFSQLTLNHGVYSLREQNGTTLTFNAQGNLALIEDSDGNTITAGYTGSLLTSLTSSDGQKLTISYNAAGLIQQVTNPAGQVTTYAYDSSDQYLLSVTGPQGTTSYAYVTGQGIAQQYALASITNPDGTHQYFAYDAQGRLIETSLDGNADPIQYAYTSPGGVAMTNASGAMTTVLFNRYGSVETVIDPLGNTTQAQYDAEEDLTELTTAAGTTYQYAYNQEGDLIREVDPLGDTVTMTYTSNLNRLASVTDPNDNTTQYAYNAAGDLTSTTYADGSATSSVYNALGLPTTATAANGQAIGYQYNAAGQVTQETFADGTKESFTYDAAGNLLSTTDSTGTTKSTYNSANELTSVTYPTGETLLYTYDAGGRLAKLVDSTSGFTVNYTYDAVGHLQSLTDASGDTLVTYQYDVVGRLAEQSNANGTYTTDAYDAGGNLLHLINYGPGGVIQSRFDYTYNDLSEPITEATLDGAWTYSYDAAGQLTNAVFASTNPAASNQNLTYVYDAAGNRTQTIVNGVTTSYSTNNRNEYTTAGGTTYRYDADGNLISETDASGTTTFTYNALNELTKVVAPTDTWVYEYNALGERVAATHNGQSITYVLDPTGAGSVIAAYDSSGHLVADYAYGLGLVSQTTPVGADYYQFDAIGSTAGLTDSSGSLVNSYSYLPFGQTVQSSGTAANPFQFAGQFGVMNDGSSLDAMRFRNYSSSTGDFTSADPLGLPQPTIYSYAANDPEQFIDPLGLAVFKLAESDPFFGPISLSGPGIVETAANALEAQTPGEFVGSEIGGTIGQAVGTYIGTVEGAEIGAVIGSAFGPVGTLVGAYLGQRWGPEFGGIIGDFVGSELGFEIGGLVEGRLFPNAGQIPPGSLGGAPVPYGIQPVDT